MCRLFQGGGGIASACKALRCLPSQFRQAGGRSCIDKTPCGGARDEMCRCRSSTAEKGGREVSTGEHSLCSQVGRVARAEGG